MKYFYLPACHVINIKDTANMQMWLIEIIILKSQGYLKQIYLVNNVKMTKFWNAGITCN